MQLQDLDVGACAACGKYPLSASGFLDHRRTADLPQRPTESHPGSLPGAKRDG
jgi:hypothetical protein